MRLTTDATLVTYDMGQRLRFRVTRERGWLEQCIGGVVIAGFIYEARKGHHCWLIICAALVAAALIADAVDNKRAELNVTSNELTARGNLIRALTSATRLHLGEVTELSYLPGSKNQKSGLYAHLGWRNICILPYVSEQQAMDVRNLILSRFPALCEQMTTDSMLSGKHNEILSLGLSHQR